MGLKLASNIELDKVVKSLGQKMILAPHIDMAIGEAEWEWDAHFQPKLGDDAWHPSGDCTPSLRELYLKATGQAEERPIGPPLRKIFAIGHFYHQWFQYIVQHHLGFAGPEDIERRGVRIWGWPEDGSAANPGPSPYHWATGSADICPCEIPGHGKYVIDFKTMNPRMFQTGPSPDYAAKWECQGNVYMDFFDMERILFVGIDKSTGDMKEWEFQRNQPLIDAIYLKWQIVSECLTEGIEPPEGEDIPLPLQGPRP